MPLASSEATPCQGFVVDECFVGLQFHWDYSRHSIELMIEHCSEELDEGGPFVRPDNELLDAQDALGETEWLLGRLLDRLSGLLLSGKGS
jgi:hypothetical protein